MADKLTSRERFARMYQHKEADRVPISDGRGGRLSRVGKERVCRKT